MRTLFRFVAMSAFAALVFNACNKDSIEQEESICATTLSEQEGQQAFAVILSKAVAMEPSLRTFLKEEAIKRFDMDYDVFYPYVKDSRLANGETVREMLLRYSDNGEQLTQIEQSVPKLTILIPDYSWIEKNCFSVNSWDTSSDRVAVGYDDRMEAHPIYCKGEKIGDLPAFSFPSFPILIVKSNERMVIREAATKSGEREYDFFDPAFDGTKQTKGHIEGGLINYWDDSSNLVQDQHDYISSATMNIISPETVNAYNTFGLGWNGAAQRDYIFYDMNQTNVNNGSLVTYERELIYRFSLSQAGLFRCADNITDPQLNNMVTYTEKGDRPNIDEAIRRMWGNGGFEFQIEAFVGLREGGVMRVGYYVVSVNPHDLVYVSEGYYTYDWTWFNNWGSFTVSAEHFLPKWYYPLQHPNQFLKLDNSWNLSAVSDNMQLVISEVDAQTTTSKTVSTIFKHSNSVTASVSGEIGTGIIKKIGLGVSGTWGDEKTQSQSYSVNWQDGNDDFGMPVVYYMDNIITSYDSENERYTLRSYDFGDFSMCLIPIDERRIATIKTATSN